MSEHAINVQGGESVRLLTAGKYCDRDIVVTAVGGGGIDNGVLPIGYTPVPSIKFTGAQAVDTGIICNQDTQIRAVYTAESNGNMYMWGVTNEDNTASITAYRSPSGGNWRFGDGKISLGTPADEKIVWGVQVNKKRILRCATASTYSSVNDFTAETTMVLGGRYANGNIEEDTLFVGKFISFELYDGDKLVLSFVPCINTSGVCGFFDTVSQSFYESVTDTPLQWSFI